MSGRYDRQVRVGVFGHKGQKKLSSSTLAIVGVGALGSASAELLVRMGVGRLILVDRDVVDLSNLSRQALYTTAHAEAQMAKVEAAKEVLTSINPDPHLDIRATDLGPEQGAELLEQADLVIDGTDNFETRYLINDICLEAGKPWVYAGVVGAAGMVAGFWPNKGCLRCLFPEPPGPGESETCDTAGVLATATRWAANLQVSLALAYLVEGDAPQGPFQGDLWRNDFRSIQGQFKNPDCPGCGQGRRDFLSGAQASEGIRLCGRNTVQIKPGKSSELDLGAWITDKDGATATRFSARWRTENLTLHLFRDGRALIEGTEDVDQARALYRRWVGL